MKKSMCSRQVQPEQPLRELLFQYPHVVPLVRSLGVHGPFGSTSIRQVCKDQNVLEPVLVNLLEASISDDFELQETFPAYGLLQLSAMVRHVLDRLLLAWKALPESLQLMLRSHLEELETFAFPHIEGVYALYYSPAYTSGKSDLFRYSMEFFPKQALPIEALHLEEDRQEALSGGAFDAWPGLWDFHQSVELVTALHRVEERLLKPVVLQMEEEIVRTFQKKRSKVHRLAFLSLPEADAKSEPISKREQEVLGLVAQGLMNKEIADRLNISLTTVISHRKHLVEKLGIRTLAGLTVYAYTHGYLDDFILTNED